MVKLLEGKSAVVTGAAQGIGFAIAREFARHGCDVLGCDVHEERMMASAEKIAARDGADRGRDARGRDEKDRMSRRWWTAPSRFSAGWTSS